MHRGQDWCPKKGMEVENSILDRLPMALSSITHVQYPVRDCKLTIGLVDTNLLHLYKLKFISPF